MTNKAPRLRRVAAGLYRVGEWKVWAGKGRASNPPTWHVERGGAWHSSHPTFAAARDAVHAELGGA